VVGPHVNPHVGTGKQLKPVLPPTAAEQHTTDAQYGDARVMLAVATQQPPATQAHRMLCAYSDRCRTVQGELLGFEPRVPTMPIRGMAQLKGQQQ
jgi:hypothetical protein